MPTDLWISSQRREEVLPESFPAFSICAGILQFCKGIKNFHDYMDADESADDRCLHQDY